MKMAPKMRISAGAAAVFAAGLLGGQLRARGGRKTSGVDKDKLAAVVKHKLDAQVGPKADSVGATQHCVLTAGGTKYGVTVTANSVEGDNVKSGVKVDDEPVG